MGASRRRPKSICCRSRPKRCADCPVVALRLEKLGERGLSGKELRRAVKAARKF